MIEVLGGFKARIRFGEAPGQSQLGHLLHISGIKALGQGYKQGGGVKTEVCVGGGEWAGGHDLRAGVKGGVKKETHGVPDRDLLMISWMSPVQEVPGRLLGGLLCSCAISAGLTLIGS